MKAKIQSLGWVSLAALVLLFQNCGSFDAEVINPDLKLEVLSSKPVFDTSVRKPVNLDIEVSGQSPVDVTIPATGSGSLNTDIPTTSPIDPRKHQRPVEFEQLVTDGYPVSYLCSDMRSGRKGNMGMQSEEVYAVYANEGTYRIDLGMKPVCVFTAPEIKAEVLSTQKKIKLSTLSAAMLRAQCPGLSDGMYSLMGFKPAAIMSNYQSGQIASFANYLEQSGSTLRSKALFALSFESQNSVIQKNFSRGSQPVVEVLVDFNRQQHLTSVTCDRSASPLLVQFNSDVENPQGLVLTSLEKGINFDILGANADPEAHALKRISWHRSLDYHFIALPNSKGEVLGIDELFGDNTQGPDGLFATDGYAALAKFDGMSADGRTRIGEADGMITEADPVFEKLRLWQDRNFDGKAQSSELLSLKKMNVQIIDLNYDGSFIETDVYGNRTMYKSVVKTNDGRYHLMFDLWFAWQDLVSTTSLPSW